LLSFSHVNRRLLFALLKEAQAFHNFSRMNTTQTKRGPTASAPSGSRATAFVFQRSDLQAFRPTSNDIDATIDPDK